MEYKSPDTQQTVGLDVELQDALGEVLGIRDRAGEVAL